MLAESLNGAITKEYIYLGNLLVSIRANNTNYFVKSDNLGRPEVVTNSSGSIVWKANNDAFSRTVSTNSIGDMNIGFPGQYYDKETDTWYNNARDYDAKLGRYLQSDPLGTIDGPNTYLYAGNNPVNSFDTHGTTVISNNESDNQKIALYISLIADSIFKFDKNNKLVLINKKKSGSSGSSYYTKRLIEAIKSEKVIDISVTEEFTNSKGNKFTVSDAGEGLTEKHKDGNSSVAISGKSLFSSKVLDENKSKLRQSPADILSHEMVGHAIPYSVSSYSGNAVTNENKIREELGKVLRQSDPSHVE